MRNGTARVLAWSPDGKTLAIGGSLGIWLYTPDLKPIANFDGNDAEIRALAWSPTGKQLATVSSAYTVQLWDTTSGKVQTLGRASASKKPLWKGSVSFSPDGMRLASASPDHAVHIWDTATGKLVTTLPMEGPIFAVAWQPNGNWLAVGGERPGNGKHSEFELPDELGLLQVWDMKSGQLVRNLVLKDSFLDVPVYTINYVQWYDNGQFVQANSTGSMQIDGSWDVETGETITLDRWVFVGGRIKATYSPDGKNHAEVGYAGASSISIRTPKAFVSFDASHGTTQDIAWDPTSRYLAVITGLGTIHILDSHAIANNEIAVAASTHDFDSVLYPVWWSATSGQPVFAFGLPSCYGAYCPPRDIKITNLLTGKVDYTLHRDMGIAEWYFSNDQTAYLFTDMDDNVGIVDTASGSTFLFWPPPINRQMGGGGNRFHGLQWSPDYARVAVIDWYEKLVVWDVETGSVLTTRPIKGSGFAWSPDSRYLGVFHKFPQGEQIEIIDSTTGETIRLLEGFIGGLIKTFRWSPDGTRIIGQSERGKDSRIHIWDVASGKLIQSVGGETFSLINGGTAIAAYTRGQPFKIYDTITGQPKATFKGDLKDAYQIVFSPDSRRVASAHRDKTIRVWDVATGNLQLILTGHHFPTVEMLWKPDSTQLLTHGDDDTWKLWDVTLGTEF